MREIAAFLCSPTGEGVEEVLPKFAGLERIEKFVPFTHKQDEGNPDFRIVSGCATDPTVDHDKQMCDPAWLKSAMAEYGKWANIREMHQPIAAGVAISIIPEGDAYYVTSRIIDAGSVKKLDAGVFKGYSIGISSPVVVRDNKAIGGRIIGGEIIEISLVDRPCNPSAMLDSIEVDKIEKMVLWEKDEPELTKAETPDLKALVGELVRTSQQLVAQLAAQPATKEVQVDEETKVMSADEIKAFLPELEKALSKGDRAALTKAHDMISDLCNKGDTCKEYMITWEKSQTPEVTKEDHDDPEPHTHEEPATEEPKSEEPEAPAEGEPEAPAAEQPTLESIVRDQNAALEAQLEAVKSQLAEVVAKMTEIGNQPDDSNAPILQSQPINKAQPELTRLKEREVSLNKTIETHPDGEMRIRAMTELRKVRAQIKERE